MTQEITRRALLRRSLALGCSAAASPWLTPVALASAPWENRLVVIILRGGMDGLDVVRPVGDAAFAELRGNPDPGPDLDGFFALHPALDPLMPLWNKGELGFVHAVSTPYRDKRSHFDGQDLLEADTAQLGARRDGWLNRLLQTVPGIEAETAYAIGQGGMPLLAGPAPVASWSPEADLVMSPQALRLAELVMHDDPAFRAAFDQALLLADSDGDPVAMEGDGDDMMAAMAKDARAGRNRGQAHRRVADFAAERLRGDTRIAAFSLTGWDTHNAQGRNLSRALDRLAETITTLKTGMGDAVWGKTTVVALTEFGRTARLNGTAGTDHGTGGAMVLAGGALNGGRVWSDWPGLAEADLYDRRDLMPTRDVRAYAAWAMRASFGLGRDVLEDNVFPGVALGDDPRLLL